VSTVDVADLIYGRCLLVSGKGGVGKTTVSAALAKLAAAQGRRTVLVEIDNQRPSLDPIFGEANAYEPVKVDDNLWIANLLWRDAMREWVQRVVPVKRVVNLILENRIVQRFLDATPGNREVVLLSKLVWLTERFDLVVVDLPASGHAAALMAVPSRVLSLFKSGPIHERGVEAAQLLRAEGTHLVLVAIPEDMVINETVETWHAIRKTTPELSIPFTVLNQATHPSLTPDELVLLDRLGEAEHANPAQADSARELLRAARWEARLEAATATALERVADETSMRIVELPRLSRRQGTARLVHQLMAALARASRRRTGAS